MSDHEKDYRNFWCYPKPREESIGNSDAIQNAETNITNYMKIVPLPYLNNKSAVVFQVFKVITLHTPDGSKRDSVLYNRKMINNSRKRKEILKAVKRSR